MSVKIVLIDSAKDSAKNLFLWSFLKSRISYSHSYLIYEPDPWKNEYFEGAPAKYITQVMASMKQKNNSDYFSHTFRFTYMISHYNLSVRIIDLAFHTICGVCVNFINKWRDLQFKVDSEGQIFEKLFMAVWITLRVFVRNLLRGSRQRSNFTTLFWCLTWGSNPGFNVY